MRTVTYSMGVSLDGYIVGQDGGFDWTAPDEEVFRRGLRSGTRLVRRRVSRRAGGALYPDRERPLDAPRGEAGVH
jgi:hypothetical protein